MKKSIVGKVVVLGIIVLFVGASFLSSISGNIISRDVEEDEKEVTSLIDGSVIETSNYSEVFGENVVTGFYGEDTVERDYSNVRKDTELLSINYEEDIYILEDGMAG